MMYLLFVVVVVVVVVAFLVCGYDMVWCGVVVFGACMCVCVNVCRGGMVWCGAAGSYTNKWLTEWIIVDEAGRFIAPVS